MNDPQIEADITAHYVDKWFHHEITDEELEERFRQHPMPEYKGFSFNKNKLSTYEEDYL
tara:strand:- start:1494 stop:1670 length:177 start_codon:yes stop_codon:yes gene_type:complete